MMVVDSMAIMASVLPRALEHVGMVDLAKEWRDLHMADAETELLELIGRQCLLDNSMAGPVSETLALACIMLILFIEHAVPEDADVDNLVQIAAWTLEPPRKPAAGRLIERAGELLAVVIAGPKT
jgi:hypothetical protein